MKRIRLIGILVLLMSALSFQGKTQEASTVILSGWIYGGGKIKIEIVKQDYSLEIKEYGIKEKKNLLVEIKKELDYWINEGYTIFQTNSNGGGTIYDYRYTYILTRKDD